MSTKLPKAYYALKKEAKRIGWPTSYETDLTRHDKEILNRKDSPTEFFWVLREMGTELLDVRMRRNVMLGFVEHYRIEGQDRNNYYYWNGADLIKLTYNEFARQMVERNRSDEVKAYLGY